MFAYLFVFSTILGAFQHKFKKKIKTGIQIGIAGSLLLSVFYAFPGMEKQKMECAVLQG
jgi:hypothetical protein